jgi:hypothetical protein
VIQIYLYNRYENENVWFFMSKSGSKFTYVTVMKMAGLFMPMQFLSFEEEQN